MGVIRKFISAFQCWQKYTQSIHTNIKTNHREFSLSYWMFNAVGL